jgi:ATP-dependent Clp endopeptidase proteolytic subunit ClpP
MSDQHKSLLDNDEEFADLKKQELRASIRKITAEGDRWEYEALKAQREWNNWNASADEHRIYNFFGGVDANSVAACIDFLGSWTRRDPETPLEIVFNSPGGSVIHGLALYDFIKQLQDKNHKVTTVARGMAASMGGVLLQAGDERIIGKNAHVLIHEVSTLGIGKLSEIEDEVKFAKRLQERVLGILAERSTMNVEQIKRKWARKDWWLDAEECITLGFADRIG